jgi:hypothetical protein
MADGVVTGGEKGKKRIFGCFGHPSVALLIHWELC